MCTHVKFSLFRISWLVSCNLPCDEGIGGGTSEESSYSLQSQSSLVQSLSHCLVTSVHHHEQVLECDVIVHVPKYRFLMLNIHLFLHIANFSVFSTQTDGVEINPVMLLIVGASGIKGGHLRMWNLVFARCQNAIGF